MKRSLSKLSVHALRRLGLLSFPACDVLYSSRRYQGEASLLKEAIASAGRDPFRQSSKTVEKPPLTDYTEKMLEFKKKEREILDQEELNYRGYCPRRVREARKRILSSKTSEEELEKIVLQLEKEAEQLAQLVGTEVDDELTDEHILLLKYHQRLRRLQDHEAAFQVQNYPQNTEKEKGVMESGSNFEVRLNSDGSESIVRRKESKKEKENPNNANEHLWRPLEEEVLPEEVLRGERVTVTAFDVLHIRYLYGLALRRVGRFQEAEAVNYGILKENISSVEAMESLLEIYLGCDLFDKVKELLDFLQETYTKEVAAGRLTARPIPSNNNENNEEEESFLPPRDMCIALLADLVSEAAGQHCAARGEGSTSKFVLTALAPIVKALGPPYTGLLLEALLHNMEEQLIMAVGDSAKVNPSQKHVMLAVSVAFFKAVLARRLYEVAPDPLHYEYHTLSKLYFALRKARRVDESLLVADQLLQLYRAHSSLHQTRMMERELTALARTADKETVERRRQEMEAQLPLPPQPLDDCDRDYRTTYFAYVNDTAIRSLADGRRVCLACVEEFPYASTPWRTLSLILVEENERKNLKDATTAARKAVELEPADLKSVVLLAHLYKADDKTVLHELMMDRYRLMCYMLDQGASETDIANLNEEILSLEDKVLTETNTTAPTKVEEDLAYHDLLMSQSLHYSVPMNMEKRTFGKPPVKAAIQDASNVTEHITELGENGTPRLPGVWRRQ